MRQAIWRRQNERKAPVAHPAPPEPHRRCENPRPPADPVSGPSEPRHPLDGCPARAGHGPKSGHETRSDQPHQNHAAPRHGPSHTTPLLLPPAVRLANSPKPRAKPALHRRYRAGILRGQRLQSHGHRSQPRPHQPRRGMCQTSRPVL